MKKILLVLVFLINLFFEINGQDPQFSMFYSNSLYLSPSFAGTSYQNELSLTHRTQWYSIGPYITHTVSFDSYLKKFNSGVGVLFLNDVAGTGKLSTINVSLIYDYHIRIKNSFLIPAISISYYQRNIDFYRLIWNDQLIRGSSYFPPTSEPNSFKSAKDIDFGTSILFYNEIFWGGLSIDHLLKPNESLYYYKYDDRNLAVIPLKYQFFGGLIISKKERLLNVYPTKYQFAFLYKEQGEFKQLDLGFYYNYNKFVSGVWLRGIPILWKTSRDAIVLVIGYKTEQFNIGYSFDFTISKLVGSTIGSHEINLTYKFKYNIKVDRRKKMIPCPDF